MTTFDGERRVLVLDMDGTLCQAAENAVHCMKDATLEEILRAMDPVIIARLLPRVDVVERVRAILADYTHLYMITGRWSILRPVTLAWLREYVPDLEFDGVFMRRFEDWRRPAIDIKFGMIEYIRPVELSKVTWIDDDPTVVNMVNECGMEGVLV